MTLVMTRKQRPRSSKFGLRFQRNHTISPMKCPKNFKRATRRQEYPEYFWQGLDEERLLKAYGSLDPMRLKGLVPLWDKSPIGRFENAVDCVAFLEDSALYECPTTELKRLLVNSHFYELERFRQANGVLGHLCRVIGHWEKGKPLAPVVLEQTDDYRLDKLDGYHRLVVAFAVGASEIPFYSKLAHPPPAVRKAVEPE